jgi:hypothetical protein
MAPAVNFATAEKKWEKYQTAYTQKCPNKIVKSFLNEDFFYLPSMSTHQWCTLNFKYIREFSKKIFYCPNGILGVLGETDSRKKPEVKNLMVMFLFKVLFQGIQTNIQYFRDEENKIMNR